MDVFLERLRECRQKKGLSQKDAAKEMDIVFRSYRRYECGDSEPTLSVLIKMADFYGVSIDYLAGRTEQ